MADAPDLHPVRTRRVYGAPTVLRVLLVKACGNDPYGYRHIAGKHGQEWADLSVYVCGNWRGLADFATNQTLTAPQPTYPRYDAGRNTWTYKSPLEIKDSQGRVRVTYWSVVGVAAQDGKVLTSFYTGDPR